MGEVAAVETPLLAPRTGYCEKTVVPESQRIDIDAADACQAVADAEDEAVLAGDVDGEVAGLGYDETAGKDGPRMPDQTGVALNCPESHVRSTRLHSQHSITHTFAPNLRFATRPFATRIQHCSIAQNLPIRFVKAPRETKVERGHSFQQQFNTDDAGALRLKIESHVWKVVISVHPAIPIHVSRVLQNRCAKYRIVEALNTIKKGLHHCLIRDLQSLIHLCLSTQNVRTGYGVSLVHCQSGEQSPRSPG
jgi:hypothetical protein